VITHKNSIGGVIKPRRFVALKWISIISGGHSNAGYTYHNMLMRDLFIMAELLPVIKRSTILAEIHSFGR
jgi:hypothetical protein